MSEARIHLVECRACQRRFQLRAGLFVLPRHETTVVPDRWYCSGSGKRADDHTAAIILGYRDAPPGAEDVLPEEPSDAG